MFDTYVDAKNLISLKKNDPILNYKIKDLMGNDRKTITVQFSWNNYYITIRCGVQTEYFTIITIVEPNTNSKIQPKEKGAIDFFARALEEYQNFEIDKKIKLNLENLLESFWDEFYGFIYNLEGVKGAIDRRLFEQLFADSRGLITNDEPPVFEKDGHRETRWEINATEHYRASLTTDYKYECTASFVLNKRAIFYDSSRPPNSKSTIGKKKSFNIRYLSSQQLQL